MTLPLLSLIAVPLIAIAFAANAGDRRFARRRHGRGRDAHGRAGRDRTAVSPDDLPQSGEVANANSCDRGPLHLLRLAERLARRHMLALRIVQAGWMFTR